jgi:peptidoglycan DL-endopeptidase CwlO
MLPPSATLRVRLVCAPLLAAAFACLAAAPAHADPLLDRAEQERATLAEQVRELDERTEALTEDYNRAVWRLRTLRVQQADAEMRLEAARERLAAGRRALAELLVLRYKRGDGDAVAILFGSQSIGEVTSAIDLEERFDELAGEAVERVEEARDAVRRERDRLELAAAEAQRERRTLALRRRQIEAELEARRVLLREADAELEVLRAAATADQSELALAARSWLQSYAEDVRDDEGASLRAQIALESLAQLGVPYVWGGETPKGFDCSGLVTWLWAQHGFAIPHFAAAQYNMGPVIPDESLAPGDLVFFHDLGHVGIYIGNGYVVHAPRTCDVVKIAPLDGRWFAKTYVGATRPGPA